MVNLGDFKRGLERISKENELTNGFMNFLKHLGHEKLLVGFMKIQIGICVLDFIHFGSQMIPHRSDYP